MSQTQPNNLRNHGLTIVIPDVIFDLEEHKKNLCRSPSKITKHIYI